MSPKFRHRGVKREHSVIPGLLPQLEELAAQESVASIVPGRIRVTRASIQGLVIRLQVPTPTGYKIAARSGHLVQEVFIVARDVAALGELLRARFGEPEAE